MRSYDVASSAQHIGPGSQTCDLCNCTGAALGRPSCLVSCSAIAIWKFLINIEQGDPHFHLALVSAKYIAGFGQEPYLDMPLRSFVSILLQNPGEDRIVWEVAHL